MADHPILVIDDDVNTREAMGELLAVNGYPVVLAADGQEGLQQLRAGLRPSLIVLDLMMPEKNGFQFRVEQSLDPELASIPVVIYSGDADAYANGHILGAVARLDKPIDIAKLMEAVRANCSPQTA